MDASPGMRKTQGDQEQTPRTGRSGYSTSWRNAQQGLSGCTGLDQLLYCARRAGVGANGSLRRTGASGDFSLARRIQMSDSARSTGRVKWWNDAKGFGFLTDKAGEDVFVHFSAIDSSGFRTLDEGEDVEFDLVRGPKGFQAANVVRLGIKAAEDPPPDLSSEVPYVALALDGTRVRLVELTRDGAYTFLDSSDRRYGILYVASSETLRLRRAVEEFEDLINDSRTQEADLQEFLECNPDFIIGDDYKRAHPHVVLQPQPVGGPLIPDFVLEPLECSGFADLVELKLPTTQVFVLKKNRVRFSAAVFEAAAQAREYAAFFDDEANRRSVQQRLGFTAYRPKVFVILGRGTRVDPLVARRAEEDLPPRLSLETFDDIVTRMKTRIARMQRGGINAGKAR